ncbi:hypothetical protein UlMin_030788 [Ulmus minor]
MVLVLIYVDDIVITGNDNLLLDKFTKNLNSCFSLKDMGQLHYFLDIEVYRDSTGLYLTQSKYAADLLRKLELEHMKPCITPMSVGKPLLVTNGKALENPKTYRSALGSLQYLLLTSPDLAYTVNKLSQFQQSPTDLH